MFPILVKPQASVKYCTATNIGTTTELVELSVFERHCFIPSMESSRYFLVTNHCLTGSVIFISAFGHGPSGELRLETNSSTLSGDHLGTLLHSAV